MKLLLTTLLTPTQFSYCVAVILKVDYGPGRMIANKDSITERAEFWEKGLLVLIGLPNATSVNQEMDALYGPFKTATYARGESILTEQLRLRGLQNSARAAALTTEEEGKDDNNKEVESDEVCGPTMQVSMGF